MWVRGHSVGQRSAAEVRGHSVGQRSAAEVRGHSVGQRSQRGSEVTLWVRGHTVVRGHSMGQRSAAEVRGHSVGQRSQRGSEVTLWSEVTAWVRGQLLRLLVIVMKVNSVDWQLSNDSAVVLCVFRSRLQSSALPSLSCQLNRWIFFVRLTRCQLWIIRMSYSCLVLLAATTASCWYHHHHYYYHCPHYVIPSVPLFYAVHIYCCLLFIKHFWPELLRNDFMYVCVCVCR